ncbi:hypothetical protein DL93DRAFT_920486 [Clavulina sp. PMI_390]|nr:hypothetical protein DL93DRAFT_920486 [Clavulina sp. PMI_390]
MNNINARANPKIFGNADHCSRGETRSCGEVSRAAFGLLSTSDIQALSLTFMTNLDQKRRAYLRLFRNSRFQGSSSVYSPARTIGEQTSSEKVGRFLSLFDVFSCLKRVPFVWNEWIRLEFGPFGPLNGPNGPNGPNKGSEGIC